VRSKLYPNIIDAEGRDEYDPGWCQMVLSPYVDDPADAVVYGEQHIGSTPPVEEIEFFSRLSALWNASLETPC
jgi:hypothetical protein